MASKWGKMETSSNHSIEAGGFGYEGFGKETWEGYPSYLGSSSGSSQLQEAEEVHRILEGVTLPNSDDDIDYEDDISNVDEITLEIEKLKSKLESIFSDDSSITANDDTIIKEKESDINFSGLEDIDSVSEEPDMHLSDLDYIDIKEEKKSPGLEEAVESTTTIDKKLTERGLFDNNIDEQYVEAIVNAMANNMIDVYGKPINNSVPDLKPKQMGFSVFQILALVSFVFSGLVLAIGIIIIVFIK